MFNQKIFKCQIFDEKDCVVISELVDNIDNRINFFNKFPKYQLNLLNCLKNILPTLEYPVAIQSWCNSYDNGCGVDWHNHYGFIGYSFAASIFISGNVEIGLDIQNPLENEIVNIKNKIGEMILFDASFYHRALSNNHKKIRKVIGMTIHDYNTINSKIILENCSHNSRINDSILLMNY